MRRCDIDLPTTVIDGVRHITCGAYKCLCGQEWEYGKYSLGSRNTFNNIQYRNLDEVNCNKCKELHCESNE